MEKPVLKIASLKDARGMLDIYTPYVTDTMVSSEYEAPTLAEFKRRVQAVGEKLPWIVCKSGDEIVGYGYASPYRSRAAYRWTVETSIYVAKGWKRKGVASAIYSALFAILALQGYYNILVGITSPNERSFGFHTAMGFAMVATYPKCMYKFGQWRDVMWMGRALREHRDAPVEIVPFPEMQNQEIEAVLREIEKGITL